MSPSLRYSISGSPPAFVKGRTASEFMLTIGGELASSFPAWADLDIERLTPDSRSSSDSFARFFCKYLRSSSKSIAV